MHDISYISGGCPADNQHELKDHPLIKDFANVKPDILELIKLTNPTLFMFLQLAKRIVEEA